MARRTTPKKSPPEPRGRLVFTVRYGKPKADKPGVTYSKKWLVEASEEGFRGTALWDKFDRKRRAVKWARKKAKQDLNRPSKLVVLNKSGGKSEVSRYDRK